MTMPSEAAEALTVSRHLAHHCAEPSRPAAGYAGAGKLTDGQAAGGSANGIDEALSSELEEDGQKLPEPDSARAAGHSGRHPAFGLLRSLELRPRPVV